MHEVINTPIPPKPNKMHSPVRSLASLALPTYTNHTTKNSVCYVTPGALICLEFPVFAKTPTIFTYSEAVVNFSVVGGGGGGDGGKNTVNEAYLKYVTEWRVS